MTHRDAPADAEDTILDGVVRADACPSAVAQARLSGALRDRAEAYRQDAAVDLTIVEALLRLDEAEAAAKQLDEHRESLRAMARDLQVAVADAAVEREAERVYQACAEALTPVRGSHSGLRRRVLALSGAAAVAVALLLPTSISPRTTLASLVDRRASFDDLTAARERLQAARDWARVLRDETSQAPRPLRTPQGSPGLVRGKVRALLAADTSGGSAAQAVAHTGSVSSLDAHRSKRPAPPEEPDEPTVAPVIPLREIAPDQSRPFKNRVPVDPGTTPAPDGVPAELPDAESDGS